MMILWWEHFVLCQLTWKCMEHDNFSLSVEDTFVESKSDAFQLFGTIYSQHLDIHLKSISQLNIIITNK